MKQRNRGKHPKDLNSFTVKGIALLQESIKDAIYLLERGYSQKSIWQLVGNRYQLNERLRKALMRMACSNSQRILRNNKLKSAEDLKGQTIYIDGYNLLITLECALSDAILLEAHDGCIRDIASLHGTYKTVGATEEAIDKLIEAHKALAIESMIWYLDQPVSNSGKLKQFLIKKSKQANIHWEVELVSDPDFLLKKEKGIIVTADAVILDVCNQWFNLTSHLLKTMSVEIIKTGIK